MSRSIRSLVVMAVLAAAAVIATVPAQAAEGSAHAVFVQTNSPAGNAIVAYDRHSDGTLTLVKSYATGGLGGRTAGSASDPLASQGSLVLVRSAGLLLAVNAGSDTISVFEVEGDRLRLEQVLPSGGSFPAGIAVHGNLVYVLDAGGQGHVSGFRIWNGELHPIAGSTRSLGLANATPPFFLGSPAQAGFTPSGEHLVVTTKTGNTVEVFSVGDGGRLSAAPVKNAAPGVPFAFVFNGANRLVLNLAATSSLESFTVNPDNTISSLGAPVSDGQAAACWVTPARGFEYVSNTASGNVSQFRVDGSTEGGHLLHWPVGVHLSGQPAQVQRRGRGLQRDADLPRQRADGRARAVPGERLGVRDAPAVLRFGLPARHPQVRRHLLQLCRPVAVLRGGPAGASGGVRQPAAVRLRHRGLGPGPRRVLAALRLPAA